MIVLKYPNIKVIKEIIKENINTFNYIKIKYFIMPKNNTQKLRVKGKLKKHLSQMAEKDPKALTEKQGKGN